MAKLINEINEDLKVALRAKEGQTLSSLRMLLAALKNRKIELGNKDELTDEQVVSVIGTEIKKRRDSTTAYEAGNRPDLVEKENAEIAILGKYMPEQMSAAEIKKIIGETAAELKVSEPGDFGRLMGAVMPKLKGRADGNTVGQAVKKALAGPVA